LRKPVIMDVDVGVDDALAIMLAYRSPELKVRAITTVSGNVHVDKTSVNALRVLEALGASEIPVAKGMAKPLLRELEIAEEFHGKDGLGNSSLPTPKLQLDHRHAVDLLIEETNANPKKLTVIATGPLTNIATALLREPRLAENVQNLVIMGGAYGVTPYGYGNANPVAEFNIYVDPEAASIVFKSGIPLKAVGLDVTTDPKATLTKDLYEKIEQVGTELSGFVALITRELMSRHGYVHLHDPMAVAIVVDPTLVTTREHHVDVETVSSLSRGQTIADRRDWLPELLRQKPNASICTGIDGQRFLEMFLERVTSA